jgi:hypothetical protein
MTGPSDDRHGTFLGVWGPEPHMPPPPKPSAWGFVLPVAIVAIVTIVLTVLIMLTS